MVLVLGLGGTFLGVRGVGASKVGEWEGEKEEERDKERESKGFNN